MGRGGEWLKEGEGESGASEGGGREGVGAGGGKRLQRQKAKGKNEQMHAAKRKRKREDGEGGRCTLRCSDGVRCTLVGKKGDCTADYIMAATVGITCLLTVFCRR